MFIPLQYQMNLWQDRGCLHFIYATDARNMMRERLQSRFGLSEERWPHPQFPHQPPRIFLSSASLIHVKQSSWKLFWWRRHTPTGSKHQSGLLRDFDTRENTDSLICAQDVSKLRVSPWMDMWNVQGKLCWWVDGMKDVKLAVIL